MTENAVPVTENAVPDMIFISMEDWDEVWRRNMFLIAEFARRAPNAQILYVGLSANVSGVLKRGGLSALRSTMATQALSSPAGLPNVHLLNPTKWLPNTLGWGRALNQWMARRQIARACRKRNIDRPLLWINPQYGAHMMERMGERAVVYDITDDWTSFTQSERVRQQVIADDAALCRHADLVIVCSERLYAMKQGVAKHLYLVPNGVEVERYRLVGHRGPSDPCTQEAEAVLPIPSIAQAWPQPVLGYTGTIHTDRVDVELTAALARHYPQGTIALIGPCLLTKSERASLDALPNVKIVGAVPYTELQSWMRAFAICIVPHVVTPFTESLNPLKLFEYLASGLPIASTDVAGFRDYADPAPNTAPPADLPTGLVLLARGREGEERTQSFLAAVENALAERNDPVRYARLRAARQSEAARHSWQQRADDILNLITQYAHGRA